MSAVIARKVVCRRCRARGYAIAILMRRTLVTTSAPIQQLQPDRTAGRLGHKLALPAQTSPAAEPPERLELPIRQGAQEGHQRRPFIVTKKQRPDQGREVWIWTPSGVVECDDILKGGETSIMHIGAAAGDIAQGRRAERSQVSFKASHSIAAGIREPA